MRRHSTARSSPTNNPDEPDDRDRARIAAVLTIKTKVSHDKSGKKSLIALELNHLDCSNGLAVLLEFSVGVNEIPLDDFVTVLVDWFFTLLQQRALEGNRRTNR